MSGWAHSRPGRASSKPGHVRCSAESGSKFRALAAPLRSCRVDDTAVGVIQAPKPEPRIMRYELSDYEWTAIRPMLPNKPRGVRRVNDSRVLNDIFWVLRSGAPWRDLPETYGPRTTSEVGVTGLNYLFRSLIDFSSRDRCSTVYRALHLPSVAGHRTSTSAVARPVPPAIAE
jgi:transposase